MKMFTARENNKGLDKMTLHEYLAGLGFFDHILIFLVAYLIGR